MAFLVQYIIVNGENLLKERESNHSIIAVYPWNQLLQNFKKIKKVIVLGKSGKVFAKELSGLYRGRLFTCKCAK